MNFKSPVAYLTNAQDGKIEVEKDNKPRDIFYLFSDLDAVEMQLIEDFREACQI